MKSIKIFIILFLVFFILFPVFCFAKDYELSIEIEFPDTILLNDTITLEIEVDNDDTISYSGHLIIQMMVSDTIPTSIPDQLVSNFSDTLMNLVIEPDSSFEFTKKLFIDPSVFGSSGKTQSGSRRKIVIIWPTNIDGTLNGIKLNINAQETYVEWITGIKSKYSMPHFEIFPNPSYGAELKINKFLPGYIKIYSISGQIIHSGYYHENHVSINLPEGLYFLKFETGESKIIRKIIVTE